MLLLLFVISTIMNLESRSLSIIRLLIGAISIISTSSSDEVRCRHIIIIAVHNLSYSDTQENFRLRHLHERKASGPVG
jgi:hypothetical protein